MVTSYFPTTDVAVMVAAVSDYYVTNHSEQKIKKQNNLNTVSDLLKDKTTEEYKMIESDERVKNFISSLSQTKIILYTVVVGVIITLFSVLIYYLIACIGDMLF